MVLEIDDVAVWSTKNAKALKEKGIPIKAINTHGIKVGYVALDREFNIHTKGGKIMLVPEELRKYLIGEV